MATKNYSRAAKRRAKKEMPGLAETPKRKARGRKRMEQIKADPDAERTVLQARARQTGSDTKDLREMMNPALGEAAGRAIYAVRKGDTAKRLWDAYKGFTAAEAAYAKHYLGMSLNAKTAKIEMMPETFEARADDRPDLRDEEQRSKDASNKWMRWRGMLMQLDKAYQKAILDVAYGRVEPMDRSKTEDSATLEVEREDRPCR